MNLEQLPQPPFVGVVLPLVVPLLPRVGVVPLQAAFEAPQFHPSAATAEDVDGKYSTRNSREGLLGILPPLLAAILPQIAS